MTIYFHSREESTSVAVGSAPEENKCFVCHEELDQFFHEESEEWHLKDAVRADGITFHRLCYRDHLSNLVFQLIDTLVESLLRQFWLLFQETGAYSPSDAVDEYKSASDEDKSASEEEKSASDEDKAVSGTEDESAAETRDMEEIENVKCEPMESQDSIPLFTEEHETMDAQESTPVEDSGAEDQIPFIKTEMDESEPVINTIIPEETVFPVVKEEPEPEPESEPANAEVPFEDDKVAEPVLSEIPLETTMSSLPNGVKIEALEVMENDYLFDASSLETGSVTNEVVEAVTEFTSVLKEVIKVSTGDDVKDDAKVLDDLDEVPDVQEPIEESIEAVDEALIKAEDGTEGFPKPATPTPQPDEELESGEKILNAETDSIPDPLLSVVQTPTVNSSLDGNVEMTNKQPAPAPAGIKIKINLFNKTPAVSATASLPTTTPVPAPTEPVAVAPSGPVEIPENSSELLISPSDDTALTNKPRLVGRKLTVLPPMTKGVETSGLCSIM